MYRSDSAHDAADRDSRNDPRPQSRPDSEVVIERKSIIADRSRNPDESRPTLGDRRRGERRRIERMGTDI
jgi:hypothetical protein